MLTLLTPELELTMLIEIIRDITERKALPSGQVDHVIMAPDMPDITLAKNMNGPAKGMNGRVRQKLAIGTNLRQNIHKCDRQADSPLWKLLPLEIRYMVRSIQADVLLISDSYCCLSMRILFVMLTTRTLLSM
jgi:hypothetical protein